MKNITLSIDEKVLSAVRQHAAARSTSVNQLVRDYLGEIAQHENRARNARRRLRALSNRSAARIGRASWTREELHER
jgi:metal-responsive CopG/Arc/MetJ family transcriptional regulator